MVKCFADTRVLGETQYSAAIALRNMVNTENDNAKPKSRQYVKHHVVVVYRT